MCKDRKFSARPGPAHNFQAILRPGPQPTSARPDPARSLQQRPRPRVTAIVQPWRKWWAVLVMGGFHVASDRILYYGNNIGRRSAADHSSLCCKLGENICLLLWKFSKVRAGRRLPGPARHVGHVGPARAHLYLTSTSKTEPNYNQIQLTTQKT